jgi:peptidoglycan/LPS O-acetylase OafA/YrhL
VSASTYRSDIDGLRAVSVLSVLMFHMDFEFAKGGFVGVDVFFVISGYLISGRIYQELASGSFRFIDFYERRARRILPAYFAVSSLAAAIAFLGFLPSRFVDFSKSLLASSLFSSNIFFWQQTDYFGPAADTQPLIHYWSLGVEEQFYLFFPILAVLAWKRGWGFFGSVLLLLTVLSVGSSQWMLSISPSTAFYMIPFRAWELFVGSLIAFFVLKIPKTVMSGAAASAVGLALIIGSVLTFSPATPFPGIAALAPCAGAGLVIWGGQFQNSVARLIGREPLNYFGRISYSLYLVHWPVIVFTNQFFPELARYPKSLAIFVVSLFLAAFFYRFVETPTRKRTGFWTSDKVFKASGVGVGTSIFFAVFVIMSGGFPSRLPKEVQAILAYKYTREADYREGQCFLKPGQIFAALDQKTCLPTDGKIALLWGDSYAAHYRVGIQPMLEKQGFVFAQLTAPSCPPVVGYDQPTRPNCSEITRNAVRWIKDNRPRLVILSAVWSVDSAYLQALANEFADLPSETTFVILGQSPRYRDDVPAILATRLLRGDMSVQSKGDLSSSVLAADRAMKKALVGARATFVSVFDAFCPGGSCPMFADKTPLHWDTGHLTDVGAEKVTKAISASILLAIGKK